MDMEEINKYIEEGTPDENGSYYFIGTIERVIYSNPSYYHNNEYFNVCSFSTTSPIPSLKVDPFTHLQTGTICGNTIELIPMKKYRFKAFLKLNEKYNEMQYNIEEVIPLEKKGEDKLNSYLRFFATPKQYALIQDTCPNLMSELFEDENFEIPKLKGQSRKNLDSLKNNLLTYSKYIDLIAKFGEFPEFSLKTIEKMSILGNSPEIILNRIEENPYILTVLPRFGWKRVDKLALILNPEFECSTFRLIAFCKYILEDITTNSNGGHTWIYISNPNDVEFSMANLIRENIPECQPVLKDYFQTERELTKTNGCGATFYVDDQRIGLAKYYRAEKEILERLTRIDNEHKLSTPYSLEGAVSITNYYMSEKAGTQLELTEEQVSAIEATLNNEVIILTAHAGAGKSTTLKGIIELWKDKNIGCCALAAKAAIRIKETTGIDSFTIHRLLGSDGRTFVYNEDNPLPYDIIIVDECSMINVNLFLNLIRAVPIKAKLILVFDDAQLPSIGAGAVAKDLLSSTFCIKRLTKVHRQAAKSGIKIDANLIRQQIDVFANGNDYDSSGKLPKHIAHGENKDIHYFNLNGAGDIHSQALLIYRELLSGRVIKDTPISVEDISIIVPMKSNMTNCTDSFNQEIQKLLLEDEEREIYSGTYSDKDRSPRVFKLGCRVIRRKNDYETGVFNGEIGTITEIDSSSTTFKVKFDTDGREIYFESSELAFFDLAYALTVHSMQGSENKIIIFVMDSRHTILLDSTLFYTAVTRAKEMCFVIFQSNAYLTAYNTDKVKSRQTFLPLFINKVIS